MRKQVGTDQIVKAGRIQLKRAAAENAVRPGVHEKAGLNNVADNGNAVFDVSVSLEVASGQCGNISEHGHGEGSKGAPRSGIVVRDRLRRLFGNERDRRNGANVEPAYVVFTAHIKPAEGRDFLAGIAGSVRDAEMEPQNVAAFVDGMEVLHVDNVSNAVDVAAEPGQPNRIVKALPMGCVDGVINGVIGDRRRNGAGDDAVQRARSGQAPELQGFKQQRGCQIERLDTCARQTVVQPKAREGKAAKRVLRENRETRAVLDIVLDKLRVDTDGLLQQQGFLSGLVKLIAAGKNCEASGDGPVKQIRLGKTKHEGARQTSELRGEGQRFAKTQEIVGLIGEADEAAGQSTDAALQTDGLLALFLEFEGNVDIAFLGVALDFGGLVRFDFVEIVELIQTEDAQFPQALVEKLAFINHQLAANDFVTGGGVAAKIDAVDKILFLFVKPESEINDFIDVVHIGVRFGREIDETIFPVNLAVGLEGLANFFRGKDITLFQGKRRLQRIHLKGQSLVRIGTDNFQRAHAEAFTFFDGDGDVNGFAVPFSGDEGNAEARMLGVDIFKNGFADGDFEVTVVAVQAADTDFEILAQLLAVIGLREDRDIPEIEGNRVRAVVAHGAD